MRPPHFFGPGADVIHDLAHDAPELALLAAVVCVAVGDARAGDPEARAWLTDPRGRRLLGFLFGALPEFECLPARLASF